MKHKEEINSEFEENKPAEKNELDTAGNEFQENTTEPDAEAGDPILKLEGELNSANDKFLRLYSDFENFKRRVAKDRIEQSKMAGSEIFTSLLAVFDDLERALKSFQSAQDVESINEGVNLIYSKMKTVTASKGLKEMISVGEIFDPELHDAIAKIPAQDEKMKGKVVEELEKGYYLYDKVLRHAKVIVGS